MTTSTSRQIAIVAGEPSGDLLASLLLKGLRDTLPAEIRYAGIGGPRMIDEGFATYWPMETLSVNGYVEVLPKLPAILRLRKEFINRMLDERPLAMIGVDAPDFTLGIELALRRAGIPTVHFVSPSIWAWRGNRVHKIGRAAEHVLCLFPFEPEIYHRHNIGATYVGHPLADVIPLQPDVAAARRSLALDVGGAGGGRASAPVVAVLPGSRRSEVLRLGDLFMQAMALLARRELGLKVIVPAATPAIREMLAPLAVAFPAVDLRIIDGNSHLAMAAADVVLLASGTATLEAALFKKPMVISYKVPWLTAQIMKRQGYLPYVGLPNILSGRFVVPELLQDAATPQALAEAVHLQLRDDANRAFLEAHFMDLHLSLKRDTARLGAGVVREVLERHGVH